MRYTDEAIGAVIRARRERMEPRMSQSSLGEDAGYGSGAGVSISRVESGQSRPTPSKLAGIAKALGVTVKTLESEAARRPTGGTASEAASRRSTGSLKERLADLQQEVEERTTKITDAADSFNAAHDRARDDFFMPFVHVARQIEGAPAPPEAAELSDDAADDPVAAAEYRMDITSSGVAMAIGSVAGAAAGGAIGGAAAYGAFTTAAAFGTASTGTAIGGLSGASATSAALAWFGGGSLAAGGAGVAGGTMVLAGIVAAPAAVLAVGGLMWMSRRSKQKEAELLEKVAEAEAQIKASREGFDALESTLIEASALLDHIAVHGGRAQKRWTDQIGSLPISWAGLAPDDQERYSEFVTLAACQLTAANINTSAFMTARGRDFRVTVESTTQDLAHAKEIVHSLV